MNRQGWICARCNASLSPDVTTCTCSVAAAPVTYPPGWPGIGVYPFTFPYQPLHPLPRVDWMYRPEFGPIYFGDQTATGHNTAGIGATVTVVSAPARTETFVSFDKPFSPTVEDGARIREHIKAATGTHGASS